MDPQLLFALAFPLAAPFWALMIVAPGWSVTRRVVASPLIVVPPLLVYAFAVLPALSEVLPAVASPTLAVFTSACGFKRTVSVRPAPCPMLVAETTARTLSARSATPTLAVRS